MAMTFGGNPTPSDVARTSQPNTFTENQTLEGTNNTLPNQTAASGSSLMTQDLVRREPLDFSSFYAKDEFITSWSGAGSSIGDWGWVLNNITALPALRNGSRVGNEKGGASYGVANIDPGANLLDAGGITSYINTQTGGAVFVNFPDNGEVVARMRMHETTQCAARFYIINANATWSGGRFAAVLFTPQTSGWTASTAYSVGNYVKPTSGSNLLRYRCTTAGTTDSTEPVWPTTDGNTVSDGTAVWTADGPAGTGKFQFASRERSGFPNNLQVVDSTVDLDDFWHVIRIKRSGSNWVFSIDGEAEQTLPVDSIFSRCSLTFNARNEGTRPFLEVDYVGLYFPNVR